MVRKSEIVSRPLQRVDTVGIAANRRLDRPQIALALTARLAYSLAYPYILLDILLI